jgi:hypothetical protein
VSLREPRVRSRRVAVVGVLAALCLGSLSVPAEGPSEFEVEAAFIQKFTSFIVWPHYAFHYDDSPFVIGILGESPFGEALAAVVADKDFGGRPFEIRQFDAPEDVRQCQILYIDDGRFPDLATTLGALDGDGLLTIGNHEDFTRLGGILRFLVEEQRVRFEINVGRAEQHNLKISSKLLSLARVVRHDSPEVP